MTVSPSGSATTRAPAVASRTVDLTEEARYVVRERRAPTLVGFGFAGGFVAIGLFELVVLRFAFPQPPPIVAALLVVLGVALAVLTVRSGLANPAVEMRIDPTGLTFSRRWGRDISLAWTDPSFDFEFQDLAPDPASTPEEKRHVFFTGSGPVYGSISRIDCGPLLDDARAHGLSVRMRNDELRSRRTRHKVRRVRIGPSSAD